MHPNDKIASISTSVKQCISRIALLGVIPLGPISQEGGYKINPTGECDVTTPGSKLEQILSNVIGFLTIFGALYFIITFIIGAINWSTAGGDTNKVEDAKKRMTNGALGLIIVVAAYSVMYIMSSVLGLDILNPTKMLSQKFRVGSCTAVPVE